MYIARIEYFVEEQTAECELYEAEPSTTALSVPWRYAVATLYTMQPLPDADQTLAGCYVVTAADTKAPKYQNYAVWLDDLQGKVVWLDAASLAAGAAKGGLGKSAWLFVKHPNFKPYSLTWSVGSTRTVLMMMI